MPKTCRSSVTAVGQERSIVTDACLAIWLCGKHISLRGLRKRVFDSDMQRCPTCGGRELKIIAAAPGAAEN